MAARKTRGPKQINSREKDFAKLLEEVGMGAIEAYRKAFNTRCEDPVTQQKARDLARSVRVKQYREKIKQQLERQRESRRILTDTGQVDLDRLREFAFDRLIQIRDDSQAKSNTRVKAVRALEALHDPSRDEALILKWAELAWRYQEAHCPACHNDFPLSQVKNEKIEQYREEQKIKFEYKADTLYERRFGIIKMADKRLRPHKDQIKALEALERHIVGTAAARAGKVLAPDTSMLTSKGWKRYGDLQLGDILFDETGSQCQVTGFSEEVTEGKWYELTFDTGESIVSHENHEWVTYSYAYRSALQRRKKYGSHLIYRQVLAPKTVTTKDILETLHVRNKHVNHAIPVAQPVQFNRQELLVDPYVLGVWLGDGTAANAGITTADLEIVEQIRSAGFRVEKSKNLYRWGVYGLAVKLREIGVQNNKHIPVNYLQGDISQRLALVQGLMDTDGYIDSKGRLEFLNTNLDLVRGLKFLLRSLGIKVSNEKVKKVTLNGNRCKDAYRINFSTTLPVFRLSRKLDRLPNERKSSIKYHYIVSIEEVSPERGRCIEVNSPSHLYLAGESLISTHNSYLMALFALMAFMIPGVEIWILARVYEEARAEVEYLRKFLRNLFHPYYDLIIKEYDDKKSGELTFISKWGSELKIRSAKSKGSITGRELELALIAEPAWVDGTVYNHLRARMSSRLGRILAFGTPQGTAGMIGRLVRSTGRDKDGRIVRRSPEERLIKNGCPWNTSMLVYALNPRANPGFVQSELDAAREEMTDEEYAGEFEGRMDLWEGRKFHINDKHLVKVPRDFFEEAVFGLGIDQGPKNFGAVLTAYNGDVVVPCWEYFNGDETTMQKNLMKLLKEVPIWIKNLGGDPANWKATITDRDPLMDGIFEDISSLGHPWPHDITLRHLNNAKLLENWRRETQEWVNNLARKNRLRFHLSEEFVMDQDQYPGASLLHDQVLNAMDVPENQDRESKSDAKKGWIVTDPWRQDHVCDAWYFTMWLIVSGQLLPNEKHELAEKDDPWAEAKAAQAYSFAKREQEELAGGRPINPNEKVKFEDYFGRPRPAELGVPMGTFTHYDDEG